MAVQQHLVPPDTFRLRYRLQLSTTVATLIRTGKLVQEQYISSFQNQRKNECQKRLSRALSKIAVTAGCFSFLRTVIA